MLWLKRMILYFKNSVKNRNLNFGLRKLKDNLGKLGHLRKWKKKQSEYEKIMTTLQKKLT